MEIEPVAFFRSPFATKFGIPKQSGLADTLRGTIETSTICGLYGNSLPIGMRRQAPLCVRPVLAATLR